MSDIEGIILNYRSTTELDENQLTLHGTSSRIDNSSHRSLNLIESTDIRDSGKQILNEPLMINPNDMLTSPHLLKDFSPNGDRIKDSKRARRHNARTCRKVSKESDEHCMVDPNEGQPMSLLGIEVRENETAEETLVKVKNQLLQYVLETTKAHEPIRYDQRGFLVKIKNGELDINNLQFVDHLSDIDTSCDTSLNNTDINFIPDRILNKNEGIIKNTKIIINSPETSKNTQKDMKRFRHRVPTQSGQPKIMNKITKDARNLLVTQKKLNEIEKTPKIIITRTLKPPVAQEKIKNGNDLHLINLNNAHMKEVKVHISKKMTQSSKNKVTSKVQSNRLELKTVKKLISSDISTC